MHDTAYRIGGLVMDTYLPACPARILEIGALNVNGTLRDHSPRNAEYVGLDFEAGNGVDAVITGLNDWNVPDAHFDLVMASSVFEHDPIFWKTFLEMCRKTKPGGHIYISAPSNGTIHRYPQDCWRFYPDSGLALEQWGRAEGFDLTLIESFVAERETDGWNDFCAVFRIGPCKENLNLDFVQTKVRVTNAVNWRSSLIVEPFDDPEDVRLLRRSREEGHVLRLEGEALREELQLLRTTHEDMQVRLSEGDEQLHALRLEGEALREELQLLRTTHEDMQVRLSEGDAQLHALRLEGEALREELQLLRTTHTVEISAWENRTAELDSEIETLKAESILRENQRLQIEASTVQSEYERLKTLSFATQIEELTDQKVEIERRLHERFREIAGLTRLIQERDQTIAKEHARAEWLRQVVSVVTREFSTSRKARLATILPVWFSQRRQKMLLQQRGLFDPEDYMTTYPDVSDSGTDPLRHYINHGIIEGRSAGRSDRRH